MEENVIGTLTIDKASDEFSAEDDRRLLTIIASIIAQRVKIQQTIDALVESERMATLGRLVRTIAHEVRKSFREHPTRYTTAATQRCRVRFIN